MKKVGFIIYILITTIFCASAQNEGNIWYFGVNAGLDFNSGSPVALTNGMLNTLEGCATISDNNGDLLFYTDGMVVYNKNHTLMPNGTGLMGNNSSTQSAIIVKKPASSTIYYIFTVDGITGGGWSFNNQGLNYSEVDMTLDGGFGNVTTNKNIQLFPYACEKVTAILHQNGSDFWIVSPPDNSGTYHSYLLTSLGVNPVPVITNIGSTYADSYGYLRGSPDGEKIGACFYSWGNFAEFCLYDFDKSTGMLSNLMAFTNFPPASADTSLWGSHPYGAEFSPSGRFLYIAAENSFTISQYDLLAGSYIDIANSQILISNNTILGGGALQLAPDNKIYIAHWTQDVSNWTFSSSSTISVINNPDILGLGCNISQNSVSLSTGNCQLGLPTFYSSIFLSNTIDFLNLCYGDSTYFTSTNTSLDSVLWDFGDINSGNSNISTNDSTYHVFSDTGNFDVTLYSYLNSIVDTSITSIYINPLPSVNLGIDTAICEGDTLVLDITLQDASYLWNDNSINPNYNLFSVGDYSVIVIDSNGCINSDTINVVLNPFPDINLGDDIEMCEGDDILILDVYLEDASYLWSDNSTSSSITINDMGVYSVILTDSNGCSNSDTINVIINPLPTSDFTFYPQPTDLNNPDILFTNISSINTSYEWNFGDGTIIEDLNNINHSYQFSGEYDVSLISLNEFGCIDTAIYQVIIDPGGFDLFIPNTFTPNNDEHNELFVIKGRYIIDYNIKIFNRWGKKIFESDNIEKYWDGRFEGKLVQQEKYTYLVTVLDINGDIYESTGIVNVIY